MKKEKILFYSFSPRPRLHFILICTIVIFENSNLIPSSFAKDHRQMIEMKNKFDQEHPLINACEGNNTAAALGFINAGADVNAQHLGGNTALMIAAMNNNIEITRALIAAGANLNTKNGSNNKNALIMACEQNNTEVALVLIRAGADVNVQNKFGNTPLMLACLRGGHTEIVLVLMRAGAQITDAHFQKTLMDKRANLEIKRILMAYNAIDYQPILNVASQEPKPLGYASGRFTAPEFDALKASGEDNKAPLNESTRIDLEDIDKFHQDLHNYWRNKLQIAYFQFQNGNNQPLLDFFCNEICNRPILIVEIIGCFKTIGTYTKHDFLDTLLTMLIQETSNQNEKTKLAKFLNYHSKIQTIFNKA